MAAPNLKLEETESEDVPRLSEIQEEILGIVCAQYAERAEADAVVWRALEALKEVFRDVAATDVRVWPLRSPEGKAAVARALVGLVESRVTAEVASRADDRQKRLFQEANAEVEQYERAPGKGWELDMFRCGIKLEVPSQDPRQVVEGTLYLTKVAGEDDLARAANGELHPWVQERVGSMAPAEYYTDVARLIMAHGDWARDLIHRTIEDAEFRGMLKPVNHLAGLFAR
jgi:hypothetical protein